MLKRWIAMPVLLLACAGSVWAADCPPLLEGSLPKLRAKESIDLCQRFAGKPLLIVNTASFCGFAPQFKGLEALNQRYKGQGLEAMALSMASINSGLSGLVKLEKLAITLPWRSTTYL